MLQREAFASLVHFRTVRAHGRARSARAASLDVWDHPGGGTARTRPPGETAQIPSGRGPAASRHGDGHGPGRFDPDLPRPRCARRQVHPAVRKCKPEWYVFPAGKGQPNDPTRPVTSLKTAWTKVRDKAKVVGRWHDNRHTLVTELSESGAGDEVIMSIAGHVSRAMLARYSHVRMEAKRRALDEIAVRQRAADKKRREEAEQQPGVVGQSAVVQ